MKKNIPAQITEILKIEGVGCQGFGILPKFVAVDPKLSLGAKTVYAYFCSLAGSGSSVFPRRDTIISTLNISKDTYYNCYNELLTAGYITSAQESTKGVKGFSRNVYTLVQNPARFAEAVLQKPKPKEGYDNVYIQGMTQYGYGIIPRLVMADPRLDIKAKGIYAYYVAHTGAGQNALLKRELILWHLGISKNTYYKHLQSLIKLNYLSTEQQIVDGKFAQTTYILNSNPDAKGEKQSGRKFGVPCPKNQDTLKETLCTKNQDTLKEAPCTKNQDTLKEAPCTKKSDTLEETPCTKNQDTLENISCTKKSDTLNESNADILMVSDELPCTKKSDTLGESSCTKLPCTKNQDTNIYTNNRIDYNLSFFHSVSKKQEGKKDVIDSEGYLLEVKLTYEEAQQALRTLIPQKNYCLVNHSRRNKEFYELLINVLAEMLSSEKEMRSKGTVFYYSHVIRQLNRVRKVSRFPDKDMELLCFARNFTKHLESVLHSNNVGDIIAYTRSTLWDWLCKYSVQQAIEFDSLECIGDRDTKNPPEPGS